MSLTQINKAGLDEIALDHVFTIGASGTDHYTFQGEGLNGTVNDPTLYLTRGKTYRFENGTGGHPIRIQSTSGASGTQYNTGVTNNASAGTVIVEVQHDAPDVLYYQCTSHANMGGTLYITGALADGGVTTAKLADSAVTTNKIGSEQVVASNIAGGTITAGKLASNSVTTTKIADNQITTAKINAGAVTNAKIADGQINSAKIVDGSIVNADINASAAIAGSKINPSFTSDITVTAGEGASAVLNLIADEGDDNGDGWKIQSEQDENDLTFKSNISGSYVDKLKLKNSGQLEVQGNLVVSGTVDGVDIATDVARKDGTNMGATTFTVTDADFVVADSTDSPSNFIWRDHSDSKLYLGSGAAVVTPRSSIIPQADSTYNLGTSSVRWASVYADTLYGNGANLTGINTDLVSDTSPQLGGALDTNGSNINFGDSTGNGNTVNRLTFGTLTHGDLQIYHDGSNSYITDRGTGELRLYAAETLRIRDTDSGEEMITCNKNGSVDLYHNNSKKLETTSYGTKVTGYQSASAYVGFHVMGHNQDHGFGTNHGSGITTYDVTYYSPIPMFSNKTIDHGSSYLSFPSYAGGNYIKFTAPVAGLYQLELIASVESHHGGDWCQMGWEVNTTSNDNSTNFMNNNRGVLAVNQRAGDDTEMGCHFSTTIWLDTNDYAVLYQQSTQSIRWRGNQYYVRGHLI